MHDDPRQSGHSVYPLNEDIQPGDVFIVQTPYEDQVRIYQDRGFLPLENLLVRLKPANYLDFYSKGYGIGDASIFPPRHWQFPTSGASDFSAAPRAAFPTYSFSVSRSEGLNVALPVQSVPIGLSLLNSASASGVVTIKDSYTYGVDIFALHALIDQWNRDHPGYLAQYRARVARPKGKPPRVVEQHYVRVINRVFLTKRVNVSLIADEAFGARASADFPAPVSLLNLGGRDQSATKNFDRVNASLANATTQPTTKPAVGGPDDGGAGAGGVGDGGAPPSQGASVRVVMASSRTISLDETFDRPLTLGYLAFDLPIDEHGNLGPPVSTQAQLERRETLPAHALKYESDASSQRILAWLRADRTKNYQLFQDWLTKQGVDATPADVRTGFGYSVLRERAIKELNIPAGGEPSPATTPAATRPTEPGR